jgi:hypothetical protein
MFYKGIILILFLAVSFSAVKCIPVNPYNCTAFGPVIPATIATEAYHTTIYNAEWALESDEVEDQSQSIATNLFEGLQLIGAAGYYSRLLKKMGKDTSVKNYPGFNNRNIPAFFGALLSNVIREICQWLLSYGDAITARSNVNCSNSAEELMLSEFSEIIPVVNDFRFNFQSQFQCRPSSLHEKWIDDNLGTKYGAEINYFRELVESFG